MGKLDLASKKLTKVEPTCEHIETVFAILLGLP
jgi:hypothetical protein